MRPRLRCSIRAEGAPNLVSYGRMRAMIGLGAAPIHPALSTSMRPIAKRSGRSAISPASRAFSRLMATVATGSSPSVATSSSPSCWSHVRRRFYELAAAGAAPIASAALERIAGLYAIEKGIRGRSVDERRVTRQDRSRPIIDDLEPWLRAKLALISQKSKLAEAIRYALSRWVGLTRFLDDGRIEIDANVVERSIRPIALNRKNALFAGSDGGGEHWAIIASLIETCKLNAVDPHA
jgi:hypothetical protein